MLATLTTSVKILVVWIFKSSLGRLVGLVVSENLLDFLFYMNIGLGQKVVLVE